MTTPEVKGDIAQLSAEVDQIKQDIGHNNRVLVDNDNELASQIGAIYKLLGDLTERIGIIEKNDRRKWRR